MIKTKFSMPDFGNSLINRKRLSSKLNHYEDYNVILLTASAGYGKTAFLSSWLTGIKEHQKITWLTLDDEDNDEEVFWSYFLLSFYRNVWVPEEMKERAEIMFNNAIPFSRLFLTYFINDISEFGAHVIMVLDDSGVIRNKSILKNLEFLVRHLPANIHMILSGREYLPISLAKLKASGNMFALSGEDFCFTREETVSFFQHAANINLSQEEYDSLNRIFEGWITGMQIVALSVKDGMGLNLSLKKEDSFIASYMLEEVWGRIDSTIREFLIETSVLDCFCPELCDYVFDLENSREMILKIENLNLFIICFDRENGWFRYHNILKKFMETIVFLEKRENTDIIFQKTAEWYESKKHWKEAVKYLIKGKSYDKAVILIEEFGKQIGCKGDSRLLHKWNQQMPEQVVKNNPRLLLNSAWAYLAEGKMLDMIQCIAEIQKFGKLPEELSMEITALSSSNPVNSEIESEKILLKCRHALQLLPSAEFLAQLICFNMGGLLLSEGRIEESLYYFEQCYKKSLETGEAYLTVISKKAIVTSEIRNGRLQKAEQEIAEVLKDTDALNTEILPVTGLLYAQMAEIYYLRNQLEEAQNMAVMGSEYGELGEDIWTAEENYLILEKVYQASKDRKGFDRIRKRALRRLEGRKIFNINIKMECYHASLLIAEGKFTLASRQISKLEKIIGPKLTIVYPEFIFIKFKFYMGKGSYEEAEKLLLYLKTAAESNGQKGLLCEVLVQLSVLYIKMGKHMQALKDLEYALSLAEEQENIRFFINEGDIMEGLLYKLIEKEKAGGKVSIFAQTLLLHFEKQSKENSKLSEEALSRREIEILNLVAKGANNEEIAGLLFITKNTVKTHLLNIYTKLDVHNRIKAAAKAEKLNLI